MAGLARGGGGRGEGGGEGGQEEEKEVEEGEGGGEETVLGLVRNAAALCSGDLPPRIGWLTPRLLLAADRKPPKPAEGSPAAGAIEEGIINEEKYLEQRTNTRAPEEVQLQEEEPEPPPEAEMSGMKLSALKRRARKAGVSEEELDAADDMTEPKARVIALIRENEPPPPPPPPQQTALAGEPRSFG